MYFYVFVKNIKVCNMHCIDIIIIFNKILKKINIVFYIFLH